jgi:hypothetical protein
MNAYLFGLLVHMNLLVFCMKLIFRKLNSPHMLLNIYLPHFHSILIEK